MRIGCLVASLPTHRDVICPRYVRGTGPGTATSGGCNPASMRFCDSAVQVSKPEILESRIAASTGGMARRGFPGFLSAGSSNSCSVIPSCDPGTGLSHLPSCSSQPWQGTKVQSRSVVFRCPKRVWRQLSFTVFLDGHKSPWGTGSRQQGPDPSQAPDRHTPFCRETWGGSIHIGSWRCRPWETGVVATGNWRNSRGL